MYLHHNMIRPFCLFVLVVSVELAQSEYSAVEEDGFVMVCAVITQPIEKTVVVGITTDAISAQG